jgi:hypothetical protein
MHIPRLAALFLALSIHAAIAEQLTGRVVGIADGDCGGGKAPAIARRTTRR